MRPISKVGSLNYSLEGEFIRPDCRILMSGIGKRHVSHEDTSIIRPDFPHAIQVWPSNSSPASLEAIFSGVGDCA
jgi:hypothetical protein